jgi:hypothetical protein
MRRMGASNSEARRRFWLLLWANPPPYRVFYLTKSHRLVAAKALPGWRAAAVPPTKRSALWALLRDPAAGLTGRLERGVGEERES